LTFWWLTVFGLSFGFSLRPAVLQLNQGSGQALQVSLSAHPPDTDAPIFSMMIRSTHCLPPFLFAASTLLGKKDTASTTTL
jgi:hypothetical protein